MAPKIWPPRAQSTFISFSTYIWHANKTLTAISSNALMPSLLGCQVCSDAKLSVVLQEQHPLSIFYQLPDFIQILAPFMPAWKIGVYHKEKELSHNFMSATHIFNLQVQHQGTHLYFLTLKGSPTDTEVSFLLACQTRFKYVLFSLILLK